MGVESNIILGIESSCDDTSAAIINNNRLLANFIANQYVHKEYGGVVPELASRAHQQNIVPVVDAAIKNAGIDINDIDAVAFTRGPGLLGSLMVGTSFAKSFALALQKPIIEVNHMQGHILAHFIKDKEGKGDSPQFPFLCLTVSGGHTQIVLVKDHLDFEIIGETIDDAAGEAFDKLAKILGLPYPGGPIIDQYAKKGNPKRFQFTEPKVDGFNYSFSGLKTNILYFLRKEKKKDASFIENNLYDICASAQHTIINILMKNFIAAAKKLDIKNIAIAGGVSANSLLRETVKTTAKKENFKYYIPPFEYCTDNAAMIAITGYYKFLKKDFAPQSIAPKARLKI